MNEMNDQDRKWITALEHKIDRLLYAVIGDEKAGSIGLVDRIAKLEATEQRIEKLETANTKILAYSAAIAVMLTTLFNTGRFLFDVWVK